MSATLLFCFAVFCALSRSAVDKRSPQDTPSPSAGAQYSANEMTAMAYLGFLKAPGPQVIGNDVKTGSRISGIWDVLADDVISTYMFGANEYCGAKEVAAAHVAHELSGYNLLDQQIFVSVTSAKRKVSLTYRSVLLHSGAASNYTSTSVSNFVFDKNGKIAKIAASTWGIEWNLGAGGTSPATSISAACYYATTFCNATTDPLGYFSSFSECTAFMATKPLGNWGFVGKTDSVMCRVWNGATTILLPDRCPDIGKTGGSLCINVPSSSYNPARYFTVDE